MERWNEDWLVRDKHSLALDLGAEKDGVLVRFATGLDGGRDGFGLTVGVELNGSEQDGVIERKTAEFGVRDSVQAGADCENTLAFVFEGNAFDGIEFENGAHGMTIRIGHSDHKISIGQLDEKPGSDETRGE